MANLNITQGGTQKADFVVMIARCTYDNQCGDPIGILQMFASLILGTQTTNKQSLKSEITAQKVDREDNKPVIYCYLRNNPTQR